MQNKNFIIFIVVIIIFPIFIHLSVSNPLSDTTSTKLQYSRVSSTDKSSLQYETHNPIFIDGDADFHNQSSVEGWPGEGVLSNPFIIDSYNITGSPDDSTIMIRNTNLHFVIKNCFLAYGSNGIYLFNVSNGHITNNTIFMDQSYTTGSGIHLELSRNCTIANNEYIGGVCCLYSDEIYISDNIIRGYPNLGIEVILSTNISIDSNDISNSLQGIVFDRTDETIITDNTVRNSTHRGINIRKSTNTIVSRNEIINSGFYGLIVEDHSSNTTVFSNYIANNGFPSDDRPYAGVFLASENSSLINNTFAYNKRYGVYVTTSCTVEWNNFIGNVAYDSHSLRSAPPYFDYNYWDTWTRPDRNNDGIIDDPFTIIGLYADNIDYHPLVLPVNLSSWRPKIIFPNGGEILSGKVTVNWTSLSGSSLPGLKYSVFYSSNGGSSWIELATNLEDTNYFWDTTASPDWTNSLIKIAATRSDGTSLNSTSHNFFTIINDPQIIENLEQASNNLGNLGTYEIKFYLDGTPFTGLTSRYISASSAITTYFGTYTNVRKTSYLYCNLTTSRTGYVEISNWNSYFDIDTGNLVKSESTWSLHVSNYQQVTFTMMFEYGDYEAVETESVYEETYIQRYYEDGVFQETLQCKDITTFDRISDVFTDVGTFECISLKTVSYEGIEDPNMYIGYSLIWIDKNGSLIKQRTYDEHESLSISMLLTIPSTIGSSSTGTPVRAFSIVTIIIAILIFTKRKKII